MRIALINENSQAAKNAMVCETLKKVVEPMGHEVFNYGMYSAEDEHQLTYVQNGILAAVLLNSGARIPFRSEEHTSELQSPVPNSYADFCLKKKKTKKKRTKKKHKVNINENL